MSAGRRLPIDRVSTMTAGFSSWIGDGTRSTRVLVSIASGALFLGLVVYPVPIVELVRPVVGGYAQNLVRGLVLIALGVWGWYSATVISDRRWRSRYEPMARTGSSSRWGNLARFGLPSLIIVMLGVLGANAVAAPLGANVAIVAMLGVPAAVFAPLLEGFLLPFAQRVRAPKSHGELATSAQPILSEDPVRVADVNPYQSLNVTLSSIAEQLAGGSKLPPYVGRQIDKELDAALVSRAFVVVEGVSMAGKSRSAYEAALRTLRDWTVLVPASPATVRSLLESLLASSAGQTTERAVVWIDDLGSCLRAGALDHQMIERLERPDCPVKVLATMQDADYWDLQGNLVAGGAFTPSLAKEIWQVLTRAYVIALPADLSTESELAELERLYPKTIVPNRQLGAFFVAAGLLIERFRLGQACKPQGAAVVLAAIDWRRIGVARPVSRSELEVLHKLYMSSLPTVPRRQMSFESALAWATESVEDSGISLIEEVDDDRYRAFSYVVAARSGLLADHATLQAPVPEAVWAKAIDLVEDDSLYEIGVAAHVAAHSSAEGDSATLLRFTESAWRKAIERLPESYLAALSGRRLGDLLGELDRVPEAVEAYDRVEQRFGASTDTQIQEQVAIALVNKGHRQTATEAIKTYEDVVARFGASTDTQVQEQVAIALVNKGHREPAAEDAIRSYDEVVSRFGGSSSPWLQEQVAVALVNKGHRQGTGEAITTYREVIQKHMESKELRLQEQLAIALVNKGHREDAETAISTYSGVIGRFEGSNTPELRRQVVIARVDMGYRLAGLGRTAEAARSFDAVAENHSTSPDAELRAQAAIALVNKGHLLGGEESVAVYDEVVKRFQDDPDPEIRKQTAVAHVNRAHRLRDLDREDEAAASYDEAAQLYGDAGEPPLREQAAIAMVCLAHDAGDEDAVAAYEAIARRYEGDEALVVRRQVAIALVNKGHRLVKLGRRQEALDAYRKVVEAFGSDTDTAIRLQTATARVNIGHLLPAAEAIEAYQSIDDEYADNDLEVRLQVATALVNMGHRQSPVDAIHTYERVVSRYGPDDTLEMAREVAVALVNRGHRCVDNGNSDKAIESYDEVLKRYGASRDRELRVQVAIALVNKGHQHRTDPWGGPDAVTAYDEVVRRFGESDDPELRKQVAIALVNRGDTVAALANSREAIACYDEVSRRFSNQSIDLSVQVAIALVHKAHRLVLEHQAGDACGVYGEVAARFGGAWQPELQVQVAIALLNRGQLLEAAGAASEALHDYQQVVDEFGENEEPWIQEQVGRALLQIGHSLSDAGRAEDSMATYAGVLTRYEATDDPALRWLVAIALVKSAERLGELGRDAEGLVMLQTVVDRYGRSTDRRIAEQVSFARALIRSSTGRSSG